jgi:hypothetical protein
MVSRETNVKRIGIFVVSCPAIALLSRKVTSELSLRAALITSGATAA